MQGDKTIKFHSRDLKMGIEEILIYVTDVLDEKGYNSKNQIVGYLLSGDPSYIPRYNNARNLMKSVERDLIIEELLKKYLKNHD